MNTTRNPPCDNLFIGDLPADFDDNKLLAIFGAYGSIKSSRLLPGNGKCAALVRFNTVEEAQWLVDNLNGNIAQGLTSPIQVNFAKPPGANNNAGWDPAAGMNPGGGKGVGKGGVTIQTMKQILTMSGSLPSAQGVSGEGRIEIAHLPRDMTEKDIYTIFATFGAIPLNGVSIMQEDDGRCKGTAFVTYLDVASAHGAIAVLNAYRLGDGTTLQVTHSPLATPPVGVGGVGMPGMAGMAAPTMPALTLGAAGAHPMAAVAGGLDLNAFAASFAGLQGFTPDLAQLAALAGLGDMSACAGLMPQC